MKELCVYVCVCACSVCVCLYGKQSMGDRLTVEVQYSIQSRCQHLHIETELLTLLFSLGLEAHS